LLILRVRCRSLKEFDEHYQPQLPNGGMFCPTTKELKVGAHVVVELYCDGLPNKVLIRGVVRTWRPALPRLRVRAGATVEFDTDETIKRDFVLATLREGRRTGARRRHTRLPIEVPVTVRPESELVAQPAKLRELSVSGALIECDRRFDVGSELVVELAPPGSQAPMLLSGRVMYHAGPGQSGVRFVYRDGGGSRRLRELVRRFKTS